MFLFRQVSVGIPVFQVLQFLVLLRGKAMIVVTADTSFCGRIPFTCFVQFDLVVMSSDH